MGLNRVMVSGNLTREPELRQTSTGMSVLTFGIAVNDRRKNSQSGQWEDYANFFDCTLFGARAEGLSKVLSKGTKIALEGKLRWSSWETEGQRRSKVEIIVDTVDFMSTRGSSSNAGNVAVTSGSAPSDLQVSGQDSNSGENNSGQGSNFGINASDVNLDSNAYGDEIPF